MSTGRHVRVDAGTYSKERERDKTRTGQDRSFRVNDLKKEEWKTKRTKQDLLTDQELWLPFILFDSRRNLPTTISGCSGLSDSSPPSESPSLCLHRSHMEPYQAAGRRAVTH